MTTTPGRSRLPNRSDAGPASTAGPRTANGTGADPARSPDIADTKGPGTLDLPVT